MGEGGFGLKWFEWIWFGSNFFVRLVLGECEIFGNFCIFPLNTGNCLTY